VYNPATRRVVSSRNVVFDEAAVLSTGEINAEQRNDDEEGSIPRTMCSEEPDTPSGESPLRESLQHAGWMEDERDMHSGESPLLESLQHFGSMVEERDMHSEETPCPKYNLRSTA
jgi:hypothetical protein